MFLPYLNYTVPTSLCVLGLDPVETTAYESDYVALGQRSLAEFPFYAHYDRAAGSATIQIGNASEEGGTTLGVQFLYSFAVMVVVYAMLVYLIFLRRSKIKAEEWLETHKNTLFNHGSNFKTEEEVIEALV